MQVDEEGAKLHARNHYEYHATIRLLRVYGFPAVRPAEICDSGMIRKFVFHYNRICFVRANV